MNTAKIAAALHTLADAVLDGSEPAAEPAKKGKGKAAAPAVEPAPVAPAPEPAPEPEPKLPSVTLKQVNDAVLAVAKKNRDAAVAVLARFKLANTVGLAPELYQPVFDAFEEELAKLDAAEVQVAQASLV